jgi:hypothetical protein
MMPGDRSGKTSLTSGPGRDRSERAVRQRAAGPFWAVRRNRPPPFWRTLRLRSPSASPSLGITEETITARPLGARIGLYAQTQQ